MAFILNLIWFDRAQGEWNSTQVWHWERLLVVFLVLLFCFYSSYIHTTSKPVCANWDRNWGTRKWSLIFLGSCFQPFLEHATFFASFVFKWRSVTTTCSRLGCIVKFFLLRSFAPVIFELILIQATKWMRIRARVYAQLTLELSNQAYDYDICICFCLTTSKSILLYSWTSLFQTSIIRMGQPPYVIYPCDVKHLKKVQ